MHVCHTFYFVSDHRHCFKIVNDFAGGMKELKVFVDLAMTSAGDDAEKICRVQSLHVAANGYATLIFEMKEESGLEEVLAACESVWEELKNTPQLPDKLVRHFQKEI